MLRFAAASGKSEVIEWLTAEYSFDVSMVCEDVNSVTLLLTNRFLVLKLTERWSLTEGLTKCSGYCIKLLKLA